MGMRWRWRWRFYATLDAEIIGCDAVVHDVIVYDIHFIGFSVLRIACVANSRMNHIDAFTTSDWSLSGDFRTFHRFIAQSISIGNGIAVADDSPILRKCHSKSFKILRIACDVSFITHETLPMKTQTTMRFRDNSTWQRWFPNGGITFRRLFCLSDGTRWVQGRTAGKP